MAISPEVTQTQCWMQSHAAPTWLTLIQIAQALDPGCSRMLCLARDLAADASYEPASDLLMRGFRHSGKSVFLHSLAELARQQGQLERARDCLQQELERIDTRDLVSQAAIAYEQALIAWLNGDLDQALDWAQESLRLAWLAGDLAAEGLAQSLEAELQAA